MFKDLNTLFNDWWNALNHEFFDKEDVAREAFFAAYEIGLNRGHEMGQQLGQALAKIDEKMKKED